MTVPLTLPDLGESVTQATVTCWLKAEGDTVEADEPLLEVSTDKIDTEIPAPIAGILRKIFVPEFAIAEVGAELAVIEPSQAAAEPAGPGAGDPQTAPITDAPAADARQRPLPPTPPSRDSPAATHDAPPTPAPAAPAANAHDAADASSPRRGQTAKMSRLRSTIARRMVESLQISAQLTSVVEADVTTIMRLRARVREDFLEREGIKLSPLPFFIKAAAEALRAHPVINAQVNQAEDAITYHDAEHIGIAVDTPRGLLVPVIRDAADLGITGLARKTADLAARTRDNTITPGRADRIL